MKKRAKREKTITEVLKEEKGPLSGPVIARRIRMPLRYVFDTLKLMEEKGAVYRDGLLWSLEPFSTDETVHTNRPTNPIFLLLAAMVLVALLVGVFELF